MLAACLFECFYKVKNAVALARAEIVGETSRFVENLFNRFDMAECKVNNMNVVSDARAVGGGVVVAADIQVVKLADCNLSDIRNKI